MSNVTVLNRQPPAPTDNAAMLSLIKRTVAADTNADEFELFVHMCRSLRLDPLRRQAYALVYNKDNPKKRRMSLITAIDGFRAIADRTGNYRPDEEESTVEVSAEAKSATNPAGLIKATVRVYKFAHGEWHKVTASAHWEEYAPIKDEWADDPETGHGKKTGRQILDTSGQWGKMPRVMLEKVAEAKALRKGWPDDLSNVYVQEEVDRSKLMEMSAAEIIEQHEIAERQAKIGGPAITVDWMDGNALDAVPVGQFAERAIDWIEKADAIEATAWADRNRHSLREFWAANKTDATEIKKRLEAAREKADVLTGNIMNAG